MAKRGRVNVVQGQQSICKIRVVDCVQNRPAVFCFVLSLFLIGITLALLGLYITERDHMPDLDAMKNWNAYIGKLKTNDYCFKLDNDSHHATRFVDLLSKDLNSTVFQREPSDPTCEKVYVLNLSQSMDNNTYGTVGVRLDFLVNGSFVGKNRNGVVFSQFKGKNVNTQIREKAYGERVDSRIFLIVWLDLASANSTECLESDFCTVTGCLTISAPLTSVPTRMPQIHRNFTFASKLLNSNPERRPLGCNCSELINANSSSGTRLSLMSPEHCTPNSPSFLSLTRNGNGRDYGVIHVELTENDQNRAYVHMFIASLTLLVTGLSFTILIICTHKQSVKASEH